jgi:hypothetical protein
MRTWLESRLHPKVSKLLYHLRASFRPLEIRFLKGGTIGHKKPRSPKIQLKVTVLSEHRLMLRTLATAEGRNMGDYLGELIERAWQKNRNRKSWMRLGKLLRRDMRVFLEHELLADRMRLFGFDRESEKASGFGAVPRRILAAVRAFLCGLGLPWPAPVDDDPDDNDDTDCFGFR